MYLPNVSISKTADKNFMCDILLFYYNCIVHTCTTDDNFFDLVLVLTAISG